MKKENKNKNQDNSFRQSLQEILKEELKDVDCFLDDYYEKETDEGGMKWFSFNETNTMEGSEVMRVSVWGLKKGFLQIENDDSFYYEWLGDVVMNLAQNGGLKFKKMEKQKGLIADDIFEMFKGICSGIVAGSFPKVIEVKLKI